MAEPRAALSTALLRREERSPDQQRSKRHYFSIIKKTSRSLRPEGPQANDILTSLHATGPHKGDEVLLGLVAWCLADGTRGRRQRLHRSQRPGGVFQEIMLLPLRLPCCVRASCVRVR